MALNFEEEEAISALAKKIETLGDLAAVFRVMRDNGWTFESVQFVVGKVWWE